eukprot:7629182-Pyramimonas_sp.AAC.1
MDALVAETQTKFHFLKCIPYLFANITNQAVAAKCLEQYAAVPECSHHRSVLRVLGPGSPLRQAVIECAETGVVSPELQYEETAFNTCRIAEDTLEGLHRTAFHERSRAPSSSIPWLAANSTLAKNIAFYDDMVQFPNGVELFTKQWERHKNIVQKPGAPARIRFRPVKCKTLPFYKRVCRVGHANYVDWSGKFCGSRAAGQVVDAVIPYADDLFRGLSRQRCLSLQADYLRA